ncbi:glutathione-disulfide reductase [Candidatus Nitrosoglobus terrae]|uniref:Glutathione-disulfide reductase n=1 Tax=Candidatus Nitrosoglobus terrae TaxID=1630141 RepID=A0A1Q2SML7_9GAMM|nr:glutathione-disulfide reductase [Candidatus Nitrosoglobus terrae]BAW80339.1 glutathione-disulfide reductase [Candidatus Nitrosoglobus terrae]
MASYDFDLFVIGAGSGGVRAARMSAAFGARVAIAEGQDLGGTCVNLGCIPKKLLFYAAHFAKDFADATNFGWSINQYHFDWTTLIQNKNTEIKRLNKIYEDLLKKAGVTLVSGYAQLETPYSLLINHQRYTAERILIATGGQPVVPKILGHEHVITSNEAFFLDMLPERIAIVGGGYIGVEFASIFNGLGSQVTLLDRGPLFLRGFDPDLRQSLATQMIKENIALRFNTEVASIEKIGQEFTLTLHHGENLKVDKVMYATGRAPQTAGLGLEKLGVTLKQNGAIVVNDDYQSTVPSIYGIGDVTHRLNLTPVAIAEAMVLARNLFGGQHTRLDYNNIPTCIFSQPSIATVGLTEDQARERYHDIQVYRSYFRPLKHTLSGRDEQTIVKIIVEKATQKVIGAHMIGPDAGEIIQGIAIAIKAGATKSIFDSTIGIHPTAAEEFVTLRDPIVEQ